MVCGAASGSSSGAVAASCAVVVPGTAALGQKGGKLLGQGINYTIDNVQNTDMGKH